MLSPAQIRAARAMINAKQSELAKASGISLATLNNIERGIGDPRASTLDAIERALANAGVQFESDPATETVMMRKLARPSAYDTYFASQRVLELMDSSSLFKLERIVFFVRWSQTAHHGSHPDTGEGHEVPQGMSDRHRLCLMLEGKTRTILFDQVEFNLATSARVAEVAGILLAAFALHRQRLFLLGEILEDTTLATLEDVVTRVQEAVWIPVEHPGQIIGLMGNWSAVEAQYGTRKDHPFGRLVALTGPFEG